MPEMINLITSPKGNNTKNKPSLTTDDPLSLDGSGESIIKSNQDLYKDSDIKNLLHSHKLYNRQEIEWYNKFNRFGCLDPYNSVTSTTEYLFFTKPDLHIYQPGTTNLNEELKKYENYTFFTELKNRYPYVIEQLQKSVHTEKTSKYFPFMNILTNSVKNTLDMDDITSTYTDTSATIFGTEISYRGWGYSSDEHKEFTLEFEDTKYLELYHLFKAYEEYERAKKLGIVTPPNINGAEVSKNGYNYNSYYENKELHDQFGVYKIIVGEDMETIIYYAYFTGVSIANVPRSAFSDMKVDGGLTYSITFNAWDVDDMVPSILTDFNTLIQNTMSVPKTKLPIYNTKNRMVDGRWATIPWIERVAVKDMNPGVFLGPDDMKYEYKLRWRL